MRITTVTISLIQKMPMMMVTVYQIVRMMMMIMMAWKMKEKMMMMELAPTPSDLVTELPGDLSSLSLRPSFCSSAIENQRRFSTRKDKLKKRKKRRMAKPKSQLFQR